MNNAAHSLISAKLIECEYLFDDIRRLWLQLPENSGFTYQAGQYLYLVLSNGDERPYSIANAPDQRTLEFHIHHHTGDHVFTAELFSELLNHRSIHLHGPQGYCVYPFTTKKTAVLLAGGTGFAPCKAIIEAAIKTPPTHPIHLYWGARTTQHLYFHQELLAWAAKYPWFKYTPVLSAQKNAGPEYQQGLVHEIFFKDHTRLSETCVYASGPALMVYAAQEYLQRHGLPHQQFISDYTPDKRTLSNYQVEP